MASIAAPLAGSSVSGLVPVTVTVNSSDNVAVVRVDLKVNGTVVADGMASLIAINNPVAGTVSGSVTVTVK